MKNTIVLFFCFAYFSSLLSLIGRLESENGELVAGARVEQHKFVSFSDSLGFFHFKLSLGKLHISHPDYYSQTVALPNLQEASQEVELPTNNQLKIVLIKKNSPFPQVPGVGVRIKGGSSLAQELNKHFYMQGNNLPGEASEIALGGQKSKNSLLLWESIPLNMSGEPFDFGVISSLLVDSAFVDIHSPEYSQSAAGEVNLRQVLGSSKSFGFRQNAGSFGFYNCDLQADWFSQNYSFRFGYSHLFTENDFPYTDYWGENHRRESNQKKIDNFVFAMDGYNFKLRQFNLFFEKGLPGATNELGYFTGAKAKGYQSVSAVNYHKSYGWLKLESDFGCNFLQNRYDNSSPRLSGRELEAVHDFTAVYSKVSLSARFGDFQLKLPAEAKHEIFSYDETKDDKEQEFDIQEKSQTFSSFTFLGEYAYRFGAMSITSEAGLGANSDADILPRVNILWKIGKISWSIAYRQTVLPASFYDKFWQAGQLAQGNPDLLPQKGRTYSSYLFWEDDFVSSKLLCNYTENSDLISWQRTFLGWKPFNIGESSTEYYEWDNVANLWGGFSFRLKLSRTIAKDRSEHMGKYIPYIPVGIAKSGVEYRCAFLQANLDYSAVGKQYTTSDQVNSSAYLKPYQFWDFSLKGDVDLKDFEFHPQILLFNLLNERYNTYAFDPQPGFHWQAGISVVYDFEKKRN